MTQNTWSKLFFNEYNIPHDYVYFLAFLVIAIPFVLIAVNIYKKKQISITEKSGCLFYVLFPLGYYLYFGLLLFAFINFKALSFIGIIGGGAILWAMPFVPIYLIIGLFMFFKYWKKSFKK